MQHLAPDRHYGRNVRPRDARITWAGHDLAFDVAYQRIVIGQRLAFAHDRIGHADILKHAQRRALNVEAGTGDIKGRLDLHQVARDPALGQRTSEGLPGDAAADDEYTHAAGLTLAV